jgi:hypothetical protein
MKPEGVSAVSQTMGSGAGRVMDDLRMARPAGLTRGPAPVLQMLVEELFDEPHVLLAAERASTVPGPLDRMERRIDDRLNPARRKRLALGAFEVLHVARGPKQSGEVPTRGRPPDAESFGVECVPSGTFAVLNNCPGEAEAIPSDSNSPRSQTPRFVPISMVGAPHETRRGDAPTRATILVTRVEGLQDV